jgi:deazaflavin-dependent oxidoreductase (nitroreductase family)
MTMQRSTRVYADVGPVRRLVRRTAATRPMTWLYTRVQQPMDELVHRLTRGRTTVSSWLSGLPVVMLTTTGAKSGRQQTVPVLGMPDADGFVLIASNYGRAHHPGWYHNLRANPRGAVMMDGVVRDIEAREMFGPDRDVRPDAGPVVRGVSPRPPLRRVL